MSNYRKTMAEALIEVFAEELSPDEIAKEQSKAIDQFNDDMAKEFPKEKFTARANISPLGRGIAFEFGVIPAKDAKGVDLRNAPAHSKFMMHLTDNKNRAVPMSKFSVEHIMGRLPVKFRKVTGKSPTDAVKKVVDWFKKNKRDFEGLVKEEVDLDEATKQVLAHGGKGKYKVTKDGDKIEIKFGGKVVGTADFDRGADSFFVSMKGEKGQKSFDDAQAIADYFAKNKITEEVELDEGKLKDLVIKGQDLEAYAKKSGGVDKKDMMKVAAMLKKGDKSGALKYAKKLDTDPKEYILNLMGEEVEVEEGAAADARRAMRRDKDFSRRDSADDDTDATDDDIKGASKNIMMQMRKAQSLNGRFDVEFADGKKVKIPAKMAIAVQQKYNKMRRPAEKEKFQAKIAKSYRDMLSALKEAVSPAQQAAIAISKKERGEKPKKESVLDRIDRKIKENKDG